MAAAKAMGRAAPRRRAVADQARRSQSRRADKTHVKSRPGVTSTEPSAPSVVACPHRAPRLVQASGAGPEPTRLPRLVVAVGGTDAIWERSPGLAAKGRQARAAHLLRHAGAVEARGARGERLVSALDDVWERDAVALNAGDAFGRELSAWQELCARRRTRLAEGIASIHVHDTTRRQRARRATTTLAKEDADMDVLLRRLAEVEDEERDELRRRREGRPLVTASVVAERSDVISITNEVRSSLRRMRRDRCTMLQLHYAAEIEDRRVLRRKVCDAALALADMAHGKGCAEHIGTVNMSAELMRAILDEGVPLASAQFALNVADTRVLRGDVGSDGDEEHGESSVLQLCVEEGIVPLAHAPLLGGLLREESMLAKFSGDHDDWSDTKGIVRNLDTNSGPRSRGWSHVAKVSGGRGVASLQEVLRTMARVSSTMSASDMGMTPTISDVALAWAMAKAEEAYPPSKSGSARDNAGASPKSPKDDDGDGEATSTDDVARVDEKTGLCVIVGHGRRRDYFDANRRAADRLVLADDAVADIDATAAAGFKDLPGDVFDWERGL